MLTLQLAKPYCGRLFCLFSQFDNTCPAPALLKSVILGGSTREPSLALAVKSGCASHGPSSTRPSPLSPCTSLVIIGSHLCYPIPIVCCAGHPFCLAFLRVKFQGPWPIGGGRISVPSSTLGMPADDGVPGRRKHNPREYSKGTTYMWKRKSIRSFRDPKLVFTFLGEHLPRKLRYCYIITTPYAPSTSLYPTSPFITLTNTISPAVAHPRSKPRRLRGYTIGHE